MELTLNALDSLGRNLNTATATVLAAATGVFDAQAKVTKAKDQLAALVEWKTLGTNEDQRRAALVKLATDNQSNPVGAHAKALMKAQDYQTAAEQSLTIANHVLDNERAQLRVIEAALKVRDLGEVRKAK